MFFGVATLFSLNAQVRGLVRYFMLFPRVSLALVKLLLSNTAVRRRAYARGAILAAHAPFSRANFKGKHKKQPLSGIKKKTRNIWNVHRNL